MVESREFLREINVLLEGIGNIGTSESFELPKIEFLTVERGGAMAMDDVIPLVKAMSAKIVLNKYSSEAFGVAKQQLAEIPTFSLKGSLIQGGVERQALASIKGKVKSLDTALPERGKEVKMTIEIAVTAYSFEFGGVKKVDIDFMNRICMIDGKDLYEKLRMHTA
jgi:P2 family phage contractile tail tube protein